MAQSLLTLSSSDECHVLCVGIVCVDTVLTVDAYPVEDSSNRVDAVDERLGGNACNTATVLAQLSSLPLTPFTHIHFLSQLGQHPIIQSALKAASVIADQCPAPAGPTPQSYILVAKQTHSRTIVHYRGSAPELVLNDFKLAIENVSYQHFHFEGRNVEQTYEMMNACRHSQFDHDRHKHPLLRTPLISLEIEKDRPNINSLITRNVDILFISREYAQRTFDPIINNATDTIHRVRQLIISNNTDNQTTFDKHSRDVDTIDGIDMLLPRLVVCAWGSDGATICNEFGELFSSAAFPPETIVDTIAAGDTFNAAIIFGVWLYRRELETRCASEMNTSAYRECSRHWMQQIITFACRIAGAKCGVSGVNIPTRILENALIVTNFQTNSIAK